jgi:hypothetical protein
MLEVKEICNTYKLKAEEENYENTKTVDILLLAEELIELSGIDYNSPKIMTDQESIFRFLKGKRELERLLRN